MEYRKLGHTDLDVSVICLGTMTYGEQNTVEEAHQQCDLALERGVNFFDMAEMYPVPPRAETACRTEEYFGKWAKLKTDRDKIIIATKITGPKYFKHFRNAETRFDKKTLIDAVEGSLKRLGVDCIDLYQIHWPERNTNSFGILGFPVESAQSESDWTPFKEVLEAAKELVDCGKIKYFGLSNETPWGTSKFIELSNQFDLPRVVSVQNPYSLLNRSYEIGMSEISYREKVGLLAYSPLGMGVLSGKYIEGTATAKCRLNLFEGNYPRYLRPLALEATKKYVSLAREANISPTQMALQFVNSRAFLTSNIIGATTLKQLEENIDSIDLKIEDDVLAKIEEIHSEIPNPAP